MFNQNWRDSRLRLKRAGAAVSLLGATVLAAPASAQDAASSAFSLEEVIVTAQRREQNLQTTPVAVTAISEAQLQSRNVTSLLDVGGLAPNVLAGSQTNTGSQSGGYFIRGIGQDRSGIAFDQGVGLYVDDIYMSRSDNTFLSVIDVDRIEVLRGPQGTLFGKNTIGGAIRYLSRPPAPEFGGYVDATVGNFDRRDVKASINIPLGDSVFLKASAGALKRDGHIYQVANGKRSGDEDTQVGRLALRILPTDAVTVDLSATYTRSDTNGRGYVVDFIDPSDTFIVRYVTKTGQPFDTRFVSPGPYSRYGGDNLGYEYEGYTLSGVVTVNLSETVTLKSVTGYMQADVLQRNDWDGTEFPVYDIDNDREIDQFSQELQLSSRLFDDRLKLVTGLYYMKESPTDDSITITAFDAQFPAPRITTQKQEVTSYAVFGQGTLDITEKFATTIGIRYSKDEKKGIGTRVDTNFAGRGSGSWDDVSPHLSFQYQWTPDVMTYVSATRGFRSGGINIGSAPPVVFTKYDPERVANYEVGLRSELFDNHMRLNLTGFYMKYTDQQLTALNVSTNTVYIQNVGESHRAGAELEFVVAPFEHFELQGNYGYLEAEYDDVGTATGITKDSVVLRSPKTTYSLSATLDWPLAVGSLIANVNYNYRSRQSTTSTDSNTILLDGYGLLNARLQYNSPKNDWSVALVGTNLSDKLYYIGGTDFARRETLIGVSMLDVGRPREYGVQVRYNF
jgi:iron complex outermembrane receptor protein